MADGTRNIRDILHDLENVFMTVHSFAELLLDGREEDDEEAIDLAEIRDAAMRGSNLLDEIRRLSPSND